MNEMYKDNYLQMYDSRDYSLFLEGQTELEAQSYWVEGVSDIRVIAMNDPFSAAAMINDPTNKISREIMLDTVENSGLMLEADGMIECLRQCAMPSLLGTCGISGPGVSRVSKDHLARGITSFLTGARSDSTLLMRAGKVSSVVSKNYEPMPATQLLDICTGLENQFGQMEFLGGCISHDHTHAKFRFPEAAEEITDAYNKVLQAAGRSASGQLFPVVEFRTSDTSGEAARLITYLQNTESVYDLIPLSEGAAVVHIPPRESGVNGRKTCMEKFGEEVATVYAKAGEAIQKLIPAMLDTEIHHPANTFIGVCKYLKIPQKWGGQIEEDIRQIYGNGSCSFLDIYLHLTEITSLAIQDNYSPYSKRIIDLEEVIYRIARTKSKWIAYDKPGTVSW